MTGGCASQRNFAPVTDIASLEPIPPSGTHFVQAGETLYEIGWRYGLDYRDLAIYNGIQPPYSVFPQQRIKLYADPNMKKVVAVSTPKLPMLKPVSTSGWVMPARGKLLNSFAQTKKGINISGGLGDPIYATQSGHVVYAGNGLRGYGNLVLIQHDEQLLSAYAHNRKLRVKQGQKVKRGQVIAEMGNLGSRTPMLHFEVRKAGKPVNPLNYINK